MPTTLWIEKMYTPDSNRTITVGTTTALGTGNWHKLSFTFQGSQISATVDGRTVGTAISSRFSTGQAGLGTQGYRTNQFDKPSITAGTDSKTPTGPVTSGLNEVKCLDN
ncbi:hypothetical protein AB0J21_22975 [Streptomyces sp. NPDC049954]|uniref:hypothetical protein n=1 Tax=Streptomyces sp. NPDC049954 TaxID=3155779 RepID=UPI0034264885